MNDSEFDAPAAPTEIESRGVTRGAYRGYGEVYDVELSDGILIEGTNTVSHPSRFSSIILPFANYIPFLFTDYH